MPLIKARIEHVQMQGGNAFRDFQLPEAALALKQGVGRLIRSEDDFGTVVICDPRLTAKSYGKVFLLALAAHEDDAPCRGGVGLSSQACARRSPRDRRATGMRILALDTATPACSVALLDRWQRDHP